MRNPPTDLAAFGVLLLSTTFTACGSSCTEIGCLEAATVNFSRPLSQSGTYTVEVGADGTHLKCTITLPSRRPSTCSDQRAYVFVDSAGALTGVSVDGHLESLTVTVLRDGRQVADGTFQPSYEGIELNGPGCGTCAQATETLTTS
jgi:hypothetical protein